MKDIKFKNLLETFRDSNSIKIKTKKDKPPNYKNTFNFSCELLKLKVFEYYKLTTLQELSELEAKQLEKILEQAETDETLSLMLNEVDEMTFEELDFYEQDSLKRVENQKTKVKEVIINSEKTQIVNCINTLQSISGYQNILNEYYKLTTLQELSELEAKQLEKILEQAETDETLSLMLNEVDEMTFEELDFYEQDSLKRVEQQKSETKKCIKRILNPTNNSTFNQFDAGHVVYQSNFPILDSEQSSSSDLAGNQLRAAANQFYAAAQKC
jgi:hypothetical protein